MKRHAGLTTLRPREVDAGPSHMGHGLYVERDTRLHSLTIALRVRG